MVIIGPIEHADDDILYTSENIQLKIGDKLLSSGTLHVTRSSFSWKPVDSIESIAFQWPEIGVQAISNNPVKSIYFMMDNVITWPGVYDPGARPNGNNAARQAAGGGDGNDLNEDDASDDDEGHESDCEPEITEFWVIPNDPNAVQVIFQKMTECQALNPDPYESVSEDEGGFMGMDEEVDYEVGQENMQNLHLSDDDEQFADAEEE